MKQNNEQNLEPTIPMNLGAEKGALAIIMQNYAALDAAKWDADLFFLKAHKEILSVAKECNHENRTPSFYSAKAKLDEKGMLGEIGGESALWDLYTSYICGPNVKAEILNALHFREDLIKARRYRRALSKLASSTGDIRSMSADLSAIAESLTEEIDDPIESVSLKEQCRQLIDELERTEPPERFHTGINALDEKLNGGFERGALCVWCSETSGGKSIALLQTALKSALNEKAGVIFSLEMSVTQVISRMVGCFSGYQVVPLMHANKGQLTGISEGIHKIANLPITIFDDITDIDGIESVCRSQKDKIDWIVVDYIQLCSPSADSNSENREQQVSEVARRLKLLALKQNICVLTASQLTDKGEIRESRAIAHHADYVLLISHANHPDSEIQVSKNRNGERHVYAPIKMLGSISRIEDRQPVKAK